MLTFLFIIRYIQIPKETLTEVSDLLATEEGRGMIPPPPLEPKLLSSFLSPSHFFFANMFTISPPLHQFGRRNYCVVLFLRNENVLLFTFMLLSCTWALFGGREDCLMPKNLMKVTTHVYILLSELS